MSAKKALERAATQNPKDPHIWYALGILHRIDAEYPEALESFQKAVALVPDDADTHYFLGSVYLELRQPDPALAAFRGPGSQMCRQSAERRHSD